MYFAEVQAHSIPARLYFGLVCMNFGPVLVHLAPVHQDSSPAQKYTP